MHNDFFQVLKKDHQEVKDILKQLKETGENAVQTREKLFSKLKEELIPHLEAEEKAFYPALLKKKEAKEDALESLEEHHVTELVFKELEKMGKGEERWGAKLSVFKELVEHHIQEEESKIFKAAEETLDHDQMQTILKHFQEDKEKIKKSIS